MLIIAAPTHSCHHLEVDPATVASHVDLSSFVMAHHPLPTNSRRKLHAGLHPVAPMCTRSERHRGGTSKATAGGWVFGRLVAIFLPLPMALSASPWSFSTVQNSESMEQVEPQLAPEN